MRRAAFLKLAPMIILAACVDTSAPAGSSPLNGEWTYAAAVATPAPATLEGTLALNDAGASAGGIEGTASISEHGADGVTRSYIGVTAGVFYNDSIADFDLEFGSVRRRHLGILRGDSVSGTWISVTQGQPSSGVFVLRRREQ